MAKRRPAKKKKPRRKTTPKPRKAKRKPVKHAEMREEMFPRYMEQRTREFGEEVGTLGEKFGKHMEQRGREFGKHMERKGKECEGWWNRTFGFVGPFLSGIMGLIFLVIVIWILNIVNLPFGNVFISNVSSFLFSNLAIFFAFFLFFSYTSYISRRYRKAYIPVSPIVVAIGITICFWLIMWAINLVNISLANASLTSISLFIQYNLLGIFLAFLFLGYLVLIIWMALGKLKIEVPEISEYREEKEMVREKPRPQAAGVKRLYRSGRDKILGGVCGGIAEYLEVDPVLIRLIWVIMSLAWGTGILAYIIAWIIIPRNPRDKWS